MFDIHKFRSHLLRWIVFDHLPFKKVESDTFKAILLFCNPLLAAELPSARTVSRWIHGASYNFQGSVTELLATALGLVHFSFDLWTSGNSLSHLGVVAHFIDAKGKVSSYLVYHTIMNRILVTILQRRSQGLRISTTFKTASDTSPRTTQATTTRA